MSDIIKSVDYENLDTIMGNAIHMLGDVEKKKIINALGVNGAKLQTVLNDVAKGIKNKDAFVVFEIVENNDEEENFVVPGEEVNDVVACYDVMLKVYGAGAHTVVKKIMSRIRTNTNLTFLKNDGVFIVEMKKPTSVNEFINSIMWQRVDTTITIQVRHSFEDKNVLGINKTLPELEQEEFIIETI